MRIKPQKVIFIKVSQNWYQLIKANYITTGSAPINYWFADPNATEVQTIKQSEPGEIVLFITQRNSGDIYIIGGGFIGDKQIMSLNKAWTRYGVRNGALNYEDFKHQVGTDNEEHQLFSVLFLGVFIFSKKENLLIPTEFISDFRTKNVSSFNEDEPIALYLVKIAYEMRFPQLLDGRSEADWPGIYLMAAKRRYVDKLAIFRSKTFMAYNYTCAITGCNLLPVLDVVHLKTFYDDKYHSDGNGIVLRNDFHQLFAKGYITAYYKSANKVVVKVSDCLKNEKADEYLNYQGKELILPEDKTMWPKKEYLDWHQKVRFENWLTFGDIQPVGMLLNEQKK